MNDLSKEQLLHKIVAVSGFLFALSILPIAQSIMINSQKEQGTVAGVSTDTAITQGNIDKSQSVADCLAAKDKELADLKLYNNGVKQAELTKYEAATTPFKLAKSQLVGTSEQIAAESAGLDQTIELYRQPYLTKLAQVEAAVKAQEKEINNRVCE